MLALAETSARALCVQLGGPVGTVDALGEHRIRVRRGVAERLGLADSRSWHSHREALLALASSLAILVATVGKIARDIALLSQPEVGEMLESAPQAPWVQLSTVRPNLSLSKCWMTQI